jgi:DNA-binding transcriptional ArsR family regulator
VSEERPIDEAPFKEGIYERNGILYVIGPRYVARVARALASESRTELLYYLKDGPKSLEELSSALGQSKANVSNHVRKLEALDIVTASYSPSIRGVKKSIALKVKAIVLVLYEEAAKDLHI